MKRKTKLLAALLSLGLTMGMGGGAALAADGVRGVRLAAVDAKDIAPVNGNPFGLVYADAIRENVPGETQIHPIIYALHGRTIAANLYTPPGYDASRSYAAVVVAHPNGGVKEQVAGLYAERLAKLGYVTLAADASFQGASGGEPRLTDEPAYRIEDVRGMIDAVCAWPGVDPTRVGALGICGGGGYTLAAAQTDKRIKAVATLSMFNSGRVRRNGFLDADKDSVRERLQKASEARAREAAGGPVTYTPNMLDQAFDEETLARMPDLYRDGYLYYGKTHRHPNSTFSYTLSSNLALFLFDAADRMALIDQPLLMLAGEKADTLYMSEECFAAATGTADKELFLIPGAKHITTYWMPEYVEQCVEKLGAFYEKRL